MEGKDLPKEALVIMKTHEPARERDSACDPADTPDPTIPDSVEGAPLVERQVAPLARGVAQAPRRPRWRWIALLPVLVALRFFVTWRQDVAEGAALPAIPEARPTPNTSEITVVVGDFLGPSPESFRVQESILARLQTAFRDVPDIRINGARGVVKDIVTGHDDARAAGVTHGADIVIWGWYGDTPSTVPISLSVEILSDDLPIASLCPAAAGQVRLSDPEDLRTLRLQMNLSDELRYAILFLSGLASLRQDQYSAAEQKFSEALQAADGTAAASLPTGAVRFYRGRARYWGGNFTGAQDDFRSAIPASASAEPFVWLGMAQQDAGDCAGAYESFSAASQAGLTSPIVQYHLSYASRCLGNIESATALHREAILLQEGAVAEYAVLYERSHGHVVKPLPIEEYGAFLREYPDDLLVRFLRSVARRDIGDDQGALADCQVLVSAEMVVEPALFGCGQIMNEFKQYDQAYEALSRALLANPTRPCSYNARFDSRFRAALDHQDAESIARLEGALSDLSDYIRLDSEHAGIALGLRGCVYLLQGEYAKAVGALDKAEELGLKDLDSLQDEAVGEFLKSSVGSTLWSLFISVLGVGMLRHATGRKPIGVRGW